MRRVYTIVGMLVLAATIAVSTGGCTKRPSAEEMAKLDQATAAAEAAERKLAELRSERMALEQQLEAKKQELGQHEAEVQDLKEKMQDRGGK